MKLGFEIDAALDGKVCQTKFSNLLKGRTFVSVYMRDNTSACDKQIDALIAEAKTFSHMGVKVIAVSRDRAAAHLAYAEKKGINFTLVSDPADLFSKAADAVVEKSTFGKKYMGPTRACYLLDESGVVIKLIPAVNVAKHVEQIRTCLSAISQSARV